MSSPVTPNKDKSAVDFAAGAGEVALDSLLESGIVRDIPLLGSLVKAADAIASLRNYLLVKKLKKFLEAIEPLSDSERKAFSEKMMQDESFLERVQTNLLYAIDQVSEQEKPAMLGKCFDAFIRKQISKGSILRRLSDSIHRNLTIPLNFAFADILLTASCT